MLVLYQSSGPLRQQVRALSEFSVGMGGGFPVAEMCDLDSRQQLLVEVFRLLGECHCGGVGTETLWRCSTRYASVNL